jgi:hypothetical protein
MLPGFRALVATVMVAFTTVIFGLSAAAWLRMAHEDFATLQVWRLDPVAETESDMPRLAMLRVEPEPEIVAATMPMMAPTPEPPVLIALPDILSIVAKPEPTQPVATVAALAPEPPPQLKAEPYNAPRTGPLLMPEIATNDAPPVAVVTLAPPDTTASIEYAPIEFAPLPRQRPLMIPPPKRRIVKRAPPRRVATPKPATGAFPYLFGNQQ